MAIPNTEISVSLHRTMDATEINAICNHPAVRPWLGGEPGPFDLTDVAANPANVILVGDHGGIIFLNLQPGLYEAHTQVLPEGRGRWTLEMGISALRQMFCGSDAVEIITRVPDGNVMAATGLKALGRFIPIVHEMRQENCWLHDGKVVGCDFFSVKIQDWMARAPGLEPWGHRFHKEIDGLYVKAGRKHVEHPPDPQHERYAGAAYLMVLAGQPYKAAVFYNRWAAMSGYPPIAVLDSNPLTFDLGDCAIRETPHGWELMAVQ